MALNFLNDGYFAAKVGIGEDSPDGKLHVHQTGSGTLNTIITEDDARKLFIGRDSIKCTNLSNNPTALFIQQSGGLTQTGGDLTVLGNVGLTGAGDPIFDIYRDSGSNHSIRLHSEGVSWIDNNNNFGIGTNAPVSKLNVVGTKTVALNTAANFLTLGLTVDDDNAYNTAGLGGGIAFRGKRNSSNVQTVFGAIDVLKESVANDSYNGSMRFYTNQNATGVPLERMRITSAGNVGIGMTPRAIGTYKVLDLSGSGSHGAYIGFNNGATSQAEIYSTPSTFEFSAIGSKTVKWYTGGSQKMTLLSSGNVGIGVTGPATKLHVSGTGTIATLQGSGTDVNINFINSLSANYLEFFNGVYNVYQGGGSAGNITLKITNAGAVTFPKYSGTLQTGAPTFLLGTDASGNVVKTDQNDLYNSRIVLIDTPNGGLKACRVISDEYGEWIVVGRFAASAMNTIQSVWSSVSGLSTGTAQNETTQFSADFGDSYPSEVRIMGSTDFTQWRPNRTIDWVYKVPVGRKWKFFFSNGATNGMATVDGVKQGWTVNGAYDGFGRWTNSNLVSIRMSDIGTPVLNPSAAYTTATSNAFNWETMSDAKFSVSATRVFCGQDTFVTSGVGNDDNQSGFFDVYPGETNNMGGGQTFSSAVWVLIKLPASAGDGPYLPLAGGDMSGATTHGDDVHSYWGNSNDLDIFHDNSFGSIIRDRGAGDFAIETNQAIRFRKSSTTEVMALMVPDGAVSLYYDNVKKFETTNVGITVTNEAKANYFKAISSIPSETSANTAYLDFASGNSRIVSKGPDGTTLGGFQILQQASDSSPAAAAFSIDTSSNAVFSNKVSIATTVPTALLNVADDDATNVKVTRIGRDTTTVYQYNTQTDAVLEWTCGSYHNAEVVITASQTNSGTYNNLYIRGIWTNNHTFHSWDELEHIGSLTGTTFTITNGQNGSTTNSGRLTLTMDYISGSFATLNVRITDFFGTHSYTIT